MSTLNLELIRQPGPMKSSGRSTCGTGPIICQYSYAVLLPLIDSNPSGGSALSPSGKLLAVANLQDGIDYYSIEERRYLSTTSFDLGTAHVVDIEFLDEHTVVTGHSRSSVIIAFLGLASGPQEVSVRQTMQSSRVTQAVVRCRTLFI